MKKNIKVAIQGGLTSFHDMAARKYFSSDSIEIVPCPSFRSLCRAMIDGAADIAIMAIENTLVGSILPNYSLIEEFDLRVIGETYLKIEQNLLALPGQTIDDIKLIQSHPMALNQCSEFLEQYPDIKCEESMSTSESARVIREKRLLGVAAIASHLAARMHRLEKLNVSIENLKHNYTRFLALSTELPKRTNSANKASISLSTRHETGGLADVLDVFRELRINLSLIQSVAIPNMPHEYAFHIDIEFDDIETFEQSVMKIANHSRGLNVLGVYKKGARPFDYANSKTAGTSNINSHIEKTL